MRYLAAGAVLAATVSPVVADLCSLGSELINGNWYCQKVKAITYNNMGASSSYSRVTAMDANSRTCSSTSQSYSGALAPLDGEVSTSKPCSNCSRRRVLTCFPSRFLFTSVAPCS